MQQLAFFQFINAIKLGIFLSSKIALALCE